MSSSDLLDRGLLSKRKKILKRTFLMFKLSVLKFDWCHPYFFWKFDVSIYILKTIPIATFNLLKTGITSWAGFPYLLLIKLVSPQFLVEFLLPIFTFLWNDYWTAAFVFLIFSFTQCVYVYSTLTCGLIYLI